MFIKRVGIIICFILFMTSCNTQSSADLSQWVGYYGWNVCVPGATSGSTPLWEYVAISIYKENDNFYADYLANGYQLGVIAKAAVHGDKEKITLVFKEYSNDSLQRPFEVGDELFSLTKNEEGLITSWITDRPNIGWDGREVEGVYFTRDDNESIKEYLNKFIKTHC